MSRKRYGISRNRKKMPSDLKGGDERACLGSHTGIQEGAMERQSADKTNPWLHSTEQNKQSLRPEGKVGAARLSTD